VHNCENEDPIEKKTHEEEGPEEEEAQEQEQRSVLGLVFRVCIYLSVYLSIASEDGEIYRVARMSGSEPVQSVEVEKTASPSLPPAAAAAAAASSSSCRKKKSDTTSTTFFGDVVDHIDEFVHASMDEHKDCLKKTLNKVNFLSVNLHVCVYVCVCIFVTFEGVHLLQRVHLAVCCCCCCCCFFPLRVITRYDKEILRRREIWRIVAVVCRFFCPFRRKRKEEKKFIGTLLLL
jgi:hypothetical protein